MSKINFIKTIIPKGVFKKQYELGSLMIYHIGEVLNEEMGAYDCYECSMAISSFNEEEVKSAFGEYVKDIKEVELAQAKQQKLAEIEAYDQSEAVNSFLLNGKARWLNVSKRQSIAYTAKILKEKGYDSVTIWFEGDGTPSGEGKTESEAIPIDQALDMLNTLEIYAKETNNVTHQNKAEVQGMEDIGEVQAFDVTKGYPTKLEYNF